MAKALSVVRAELEREGLDSAFLSKPSRDMECGVGFMCDGERRQISYIVMADPLHGPELHRWEDAKETDMQATDQPRATTKD